MRPTSAPQSNGAAEVFDIPPERQNRISVHKIGKGEK
jgi:hypothetical protein